MSKSPFDDPEGRYRVLINSEGQYSLWPSRIDVPGGWRVSFGDASREACLEHISREWTDMRPRSVQRPS